MPRPNEKWERKYNNQEESKLSLEDSKLTAIPKLACGCLEAADILKQSLRTTDSPLSRLLEMDEMKLYGNRIVAAFSWAGADHIKLIEGVKNRDPSLLNCIKGVPCG